MNRLFQYIRRRRYVKQAFLLLLVLSGTCYFAHSAEIGARHTLVFDDVVKKAKEASELPFENIQAKGIPRSLLDMSYDEWRDIRFRPDKALWLNQDTPFRVQFFHLGFLYNIPVRINIVDSERVRPLPFTKDYFDYGKNTFQGEIPADMGYAGFRMHYPLNRKDYYDEVAVFVGASYFRAVAKGGRFGLSGRGLAVDTATLSGEEFPFFKEFWLIKPYKNSSEMTVYGLLDSPSVTGAYRFTVIPGDETLMEVKAKLFFRRKVGKLGIAPLTSMFLYGEEEFPFHRKGYRPEIHDSDGLSLELGDGEEIWRPIVNRENLFINSFRAAGVKEFGLLQRDLNFDHYQDLEARHELRPSVSVIPDGNWGPGSVELVQIPSDREYNDNIVAYWVPERAYGIKEPIEISYTLRWFGWKPGATDKGYVSDTRIEKDDKSDDTKFVLDFRGNAIELLPEGTPVEADIDIDSERYVLGEHQIMKNPITRGWRLVLVVSSRGLQMPDEVVTPVRPAGEIRVFLKKGQQRITEIWSYGVQ